MALVVVSEKGSYIWRKELESRSSFLIVIIDLGW
jgi:hypothetical protein